jgi:hypothetical protein
MIKMAKNGKQKQQQIKPKPAPQQRRQRAQQALPKGTFSALGGMAGSLVPIPGASIVGSLLGKGISRVVGFGDYKVSENSLATYSYADSVVPAFGKAMSETRITHREFVMNIVAPDNPTAYNNQTFVLNPSNTTLFPWLSTVAKNYQQYRINGMVITLKSTTSEYTAAGALGVYGIASNYNVTDSPYPDLASFENSEFAVVSKPSMSVMHCIECKDFVKGEKLLYVRDANATIAGAVQDDRFYDFARVQVMTDGLPQAPGTVLAQLWVSYDITLCKPIVQSVGVGPGPTPCPTLYPAVVCVSNEDGTTAMTNNSGFADLFYLGAVDVDLANSTEYSLLPNNTGTTTSPLSGTVVVFPSGNDYMTIRRNGVYFITFSVTASTVPNATNWALADPFVAQTRATAVPSGSATAVLHDGFYSGAVNKQLVPFAPSRMGAADDTLATLSYIITVEGADNSNTVRFNYPKFTTQSANSLVNVRFCMSLRWIALKYSTATLPP